MVERSFSQLQSKLPHQFTTCSMALTTLTTHEEEKRHVNTHGNEESYGTERNQLDRSFREAEQGPSSRAPARGDFRGQIWPLPIL